MSEELKVALSELKPDSGVCTIITDCKCKSDQAGLQLLLEKLFHKDASVVLWQMQSILWGKWDKNGFEWADADDVFPEGWLEIRVFNEKEELHLYNNGKELYGRYRSDEGETGCEYVDSFARMWGKHDSNNANVKAGFVCLKDAQRKMAMTVPAADNSAKRYGLLTRNYVTANEVNGQAGYTDYRFVKIASADLEGV